MVRLTVIGDGPDYAHLAQLFVEQGFDDEWRQSEKVILTQGKWRTKSVFHH